MQRGLSTRSTHSSRMEMMEIRLWFATAAVAASYYVWWRWSEASRRREFVRGSSALPSPMPLLPTWFGFFGGHTLRLEEGKVRGTSLPVVLCHHVVFLLFQCDERVILQENAMWYT